MKFAFMSFSAPAASLTELLSMAKTYGYDGIEPRIGAGHGHGVEVDASVASRAAIRQAAAEAGVAICCIATSCRFADPAQSAEMIELGRQAIDLAADVGCPAIRVFGGAIPAGIGREQATGTVAGALRSLAGQAADRGVNVCLETHDDWCDPSHVAAVMEQADQPRLAVNWDIMHPVRQAGATMESAFAALQPWIRHVHVHDGVEAGAPLAFKPIGEGVVDHAAALRLLHTIRYDGYLSGEWINWTPPEVHLPTERATLRRLESVLPV